MKVARRVLFLVCMMVAGSPAADHPTDLDHLLRQVREANGRDAAVRAEREKRFLDEKADRQKLLANLRGTVEAERVRGDSLRQQFDTNEQELKQLEADLQARVGNFGELFGTVRQAANDLHALLADSLVSVQYPGRAEWFDVLGKARKLPDISELERVWLLMQQEIAESGRVVSFPAKVVSTAGITESRKVTRVGVFSAVSSGNYLRFLPESGTLMELQRQPAGRYRALAQSLADGHEGYLQMVVDPTRGSLLGLLVQAPTLRERLQQGGIVGYLIIGLGTVGLLIVVQRLVYLTIVGRRIRQQLANPKLPRRDNPLGRVLSAVSAISLSSIESLELKLDEAIQIETPRLTRGQMFLKLLAAVAPLLGLLGTVTGMILTFQSISLFGTGDPKLMAGGISQALVTTVLGLSVAIPLLFLHSLIASRSHTLVQILEEQSAGILVGATAQITEDVQTT